MDTPVGASAVDILLALVTYNTSPVKSHHVVAKVNQFIPTQAALLPDVSEEDWVRITGIEPRPDVKKLYESTFYPSIKQWLRDVGLLTETPPGEKKPKKSKANVAQFLNRLLGLPLEKQQVLFK